MKGRVPRNAVRPLAASVLATLIVVSQTPADAGVTSSGIFRYVSRSQVFPAVAGEGQRAADCPGDTTVTGMGGSLPRSVNGDLPFVGLADGDDQDGDPDDATLAYARWTGATKRVTVKGVAVCTTLDSVVHVSANGSLASGGAIQVLDVDCPGGTRSIGGGGGSLDPNVSLTGSFPSSATDWQISAQNLGGAATPFSVYGSCLPTTERTVSVEQTVIDVQDSTKPNIKVPCPAGSKVSGGGYFGLPARSTVPFDGRDSDLAPDDGWAVRVPNDSGSPVQVTVLSICVGKPLA